jgi:aldehyde:ferredoxin oxidoreductase
MIRDLSRQKVLNVDLSSRKISTQDVKSEEIVTFLGGRGINAKILYQRIRPGIDPLGPENVLIFGTGTLTGSAAPAATRIFVTTKSPMTGLYVKSSAGGDWGAELKYAGYDHVVLSGSAEKPVYLWIDDGKVELRDAHHLWGKGTRETDRLIKEELGDDKIQTALIGPAGENKVLFATVVISLFASASRCGVGTVMGSKNLKAIAVRGSGGLQPVDKRSFRELSIRLIELLRKDPFMQELHRYGSSGMVSLLNQMGIMPAFNFQRGQMEGVEKLSGQYCEKEGFIVGSRACRGCTVACRLIVRSKDHQYGEFRDSGPWVETICALGSQCGHTDTEAVLKGNHLCMDYGLDVSSAGHSISWAMETYEKGVIRDEQTDGLDLHFGNPEIVLALIRRIAFREGRLGDLLANGTKRASEKIGGDSWKWAIQARGLEMTMVDPRVMKGYGLGFALNPRGPDHLSAAPIAELGFTEEAENLIEKIAGDRKYAKATATEKKPEIVRWHEEVFCAMDGFGICYMVTNVSTPKGLGPEHMRELFEYGTGMTLTEEELMRAGRRIFTLERAFNVREGLRREDDKLPWRMMNEPLADGPDKGAMTSKEELDRMLDEYYEIVGWDKVSGIPMRETLENLGLINLCGDCLES